MKARDYENLEEILCGELESITKKGSISRSELDTVQKLLSAIEKTKTIVMFDEQDYSEYDGGRSQRGYNRSRASYNSYDDGISRNDSYANRGQHYVRGHYSRAKDGVAEQIDQMMNEGNMSYEDRQTLARAMEVLGK